MGDKTKIEWSDATWNPVRGCSRVSPGCGGANHQGGCYAEKIAARFSDPGQAFHGFAIRTPHGGQWTGRLALVEEALTLPLRWKKPRRVFVNSMSDLFHENLPDEAIDKVMAVGALAHHHTLQILTKRSGRMRRYMSDPQTPSRIVNRALRMRELPRWWQWPMRNVWLGVSAEDQERADERIPDLLDTPAAVRFVSAEPLLGPIRLREKLGDDWLASGKSGERRGLDLVIVGGESGPKSRGNWVPNVRSIVRQCASAKVACFVKQLGANVQDRNDAGFDGCEPHAWPDIDPADVEHDINGYREEHQGATVRIRLRDRKGGDMAEWPEDLRVRQLPESSRA